MADITATDLIAKIQEAKGNVSAVARAFGVSRKTIYNYIAMVARSLGVSRTAVYNWVNAPDDKRRFDHAQTQNGDLNMAAIAAEITQLRQRVEQLEQKVAEWTADS